MPYAGSRDRGSSVWNSYVQGAQLKMSREEQRRAAAFQKLQESLALDQAERAKERLKLDQAQETRYAAQSQQGMEIDRNQEARAAEGFEIDKAGLAAGQEKSKQVGQAKYGAARQWASGLLKEHPELQPDFGEMQSTLNAHQEWEPDVKAAYVETGLGRIKGKADALTKQKLLRQTADDLATGIYGDRNTYESNPEDVKSIQALSDAYQNEDLTTAQYSKALQDKKVEKINRDSKVEHRQGIRAFFQSKIDTSGFLPGSPEMLKAITIRNSAEDLVFTPEQANEQFDAISAKPAAGAKDTGPKPGDLLEWADRLESEPEGKGKSLIERVKMARELLGSGQHAVASPEERKLALDQQRNTPDTSHQPGSRKLAPASASAEAAGSESRLKVLAKRGDPKAYAVEWQGAHPGASKEEFKAAMKAAGFGG